MNPLLSLSIMGGKIAAVLSRLRGFRGSSLPGRVARRIYPGVLRELAAQVRHGIIIVSGTNGKTTTTNMIANILAGAGYKTVANFEGANLHSGVTTSLLINAGIGGKFDCDYAIMEVDEASVPVVLADVNPKIVVLTNFFRDQLDRYWELDKIVGVILEPLEKLGQTKLVLNADDPLVAQFEQKTGLPVYYYGIERHKSSLTSSKQTREAKFCPLCGAALEYEYYHYSQLGGYHCPQCLFARPEPQLEAAGPELDDGSIRCRLLCAGQEIPLVVQARGLYNLYNALAAISVGLLLGIECGKIIASLGKYRPVTGRMEVFSHRGKKVLLNLVKNPTGFNEGLNTMMNLQETRDVLIFINDNEADGTDVSWLWDVDFELLEEDHASITGFICSGKRAEEMALRLKYAGVPLDKIKVERDMRRAVELTLKGSAALAYIFTTYTALWPVHGIIKNLADREGKL